MMDKVVGWTGGLNEAACAALEAKGAMIVSPTKVGYIVMTSDGAGLKRKFHAKQRALNKPGVVLCGSMEQLRALAVLTPEIDAFYQRHMDDDILLGCILPWQTSALALIPDDGMRQLMMDRRGTSCFVIRFGVPSEALAAAMWSRGRLVFASSANPSGKGNRGVFDGIGDRIRDEADLILSADEYVRSIQPEKSEATRFEQGVMVAMVDADGVLVPEQNGQRSTTPCPILIRRGLDVSRVMDRLSIHFPSWNYRHGEYY